MKLLFFLFSLTALAHGADRPPNIVFILADAFEGKIVSAVGRQLERDFGRGFGEKNLRRMIQFAEVFPEREIVVSLIRQFR